MVPWSLVKWRYMGPKIGVIISSAQGLSLLRGPQRQPPKLLMTELGSGSGGDGRGYRPLPVPSGIGAPEAF